jgi:hypothetical protein
MLLALGNKPLLAEEPLFFERTIETASAIVHFHREDQTFARRLGEILDYARASVGKHYGQVDGKVTAYIYRTSEEMARGLQQVLYYQPWEVQAVSRVGISECTQGTLHVRRDRQKWKNATVNPWRIVIDEYVQGVTAQRFGSKPAKSATWLEEGVSSYIAYKAFKDKFPEFADQHLEQRQKTAFKFLIVGQFPHFRDIATREVWYANITNGWLTWNSQYAAAYMGVLYIVDHYGFDTVEQILAAVSRGVPYTDAIEDVLDLTLEEFEYRVSLSVFLNGVFELYFEYSVLLLILVGLVLLIVFQRMHACGGNLATRT